MIDKIFDSFEQIQATMKKEAKELEGKLTAFGDSLEGYHSKIEEIIKKISKIVLPLVQNDRKIALQTTLQASIAQAKLGNLILNYPELIAWKETNTVQERSALIKEKITLLRPVLLALLENDRIKSDEIIRIVHEMVDIGIVVPESFSGEDDALREHQLELIRPKVAQLSTIFSAEESPLLFTASSFKDITDFVGKLKSATNPNTTDLVSQFLYSEFSATIQSLIDDYDPDSVPSAAFQESVITELNTLIQQPETIYESTRFNGVFLSVATEQLKDKHIAEGVQGTALIRYNRLLLDDAYPLELLGAYASDSTTSDSFVDTAKNVMGFVNALPTDTYTEGMLYIAGKPFAIATPDVLIDHNPTITYELEDGTLLSVEKTSEKKLKVQLGKAEEDKATTVAVLMTELSNVGITAHCVEPIYPDDEKLTQYVQVVDEDYGILTIAGAPFQISPANALANHTPTITYDLKIPIVEIKDGELTIQLGEIGSETTLEELKTILEADENINSVILSNANKHTKLIKDDSKVTSYDKNTGLLTIVGEQFQLSPVNPWNLTNPTLEVTYLQARGATPVATIVNNNGSNELKLQLGDVGSRTTVQQLIYELDNKLIDTEVTYIAPLILAAPESTFKDYKTLTTTKYAALSNELEDLDGKVDVPPQVETTIEKIEQTVEELGLDTIYDSSKLVNKLANKLRDDWLKDYPDYHFLVDTAELLIIDWLGMDASADQFDEVFKIINSSILEISEKKLTLKFTKADVFDPAKTTVSFNLDIAEPRVTLNEDGALSIRLGKAGDSSLDQLKTALERKLQEKDALAMVTMSDSKSNLYLLSDPTEPTNGWCTPKYELEFGGIDLLALLQKGLIIAKFIIDNRISIAYKEYEEVSPDEGLDSSQEVGSTSSGQGSAVPQADQSATPQPTSGQSGAPSAPEAYSPTPTSTAINIDIWSIVLGLLDGYWDHVIPFLPSDLQPWARHLQKGTLKQAVSNILDVKGMTNELENRTNAFLKLFDYQLRPDFYNATTKELVIAGEVFTLSMATGNEDCLVDHTPTVTYDASDSTQPDVTINAADKTLTIALGAAPSPTIAGQLKTALEQQPEIATVALADFKVDTLLPEAYDAQVVPDSYNSATGELMLTGRKFTLSGTALTDHTPKLSYDQDSNIPIVTVESNQTLTIQLGKKENPTTVGELESTLTNLTEITSVTSVIDHRGDQLLTNNYDHGTQKLTLCGKIFTLKLASDDSDALQDHTPNVGLITHATPKVSIENDIFTIQLGVEESPTTVGLLKECLEKNVHIDTVTSDEEDHTELIPDDYVPANGKLLISGQLLTLTLNTPEALNDQFLVVKYDQATSTPTVAITADAFTISLGTASNPTTVNELKTAFEANAKIASVAIDDGIKTLLPNSYDASTGELILSGKKVTIHFATGKEGMLTADHLLIAKYRLEVDTEPVVVINADNKTLEICIGSNAFPSSTYELKEVMEAMPQIEALEGDFPTLQMSVRESIEFIFPLLKSLISQVLGDYSDTDNEKPGSIAQVTEVPFKLAALFTELVLNHIPLPKAFKDFLTGTPKPDEALVSVGCLLLALPYAALEQVLALIFTTQKEQQQAA